MPTQTDSPFEHSIYTVQADSIQIARARCDILDESGTQILWALLLGFLPGLKIRVYAGKSKRTEILRINRPREFGPLAEMYDYPIFDSMSNSKIGTVRLPKGRWKLKPSEKIYAHLATPEPSTMDDWMLLDHSDQKLGYFKGVPESDDKSKQNVWDMYVDDDRVCRVCEAVEWDFGTRLRITADCSLDTLGKIDRRLALSSVLVQMALRGEIMDMG